MRGAGGPPAWAVRLRRIEDERDALIEDLLVALAEAEAQAPDDPWAALDRASAVVLTAKRLATVNQLIDKHNRYYPCEGNLPMDPKTGDYLDRGRPWAPLSPLGREAVVEATLARRRRRLSAPR